MNNPAKFVYWLKHLWRAMDKLEELEDALVQDFWNDPMEEEQSENPIVILFVMAINLLYEIALEDVDVNKRAKYGDLVLPEIIGRKRPISDLMEEFKDE